MLSHKPIARLTLVSTRSVFFAKQNLNAARMEAGGIEL